jgi:eukaryotic-like serine/threonine-protein kinase
LINFEYQTIYNLFFLVRFRMHADSPLLQPAWLTAQCPREGRYVIGPLLGRGGMGDVHEAWDVVLCRTVALKVLKAIEPSALIRFMHEAQIHARVVHPNICRIYDVDNYEGSLRVAMQLVRGSNLEQACAELSVREVVSIMALVAQAVHVVHRLNLIHRDLKPSNILLERNSEGDWTPFVCDFGLAVALDEPALTFTHGVIGTPAYMAPEQLHGNRERISPATDVYALGGTLHYALTGRPPGHLGMKGPAPGDPAMPRDLRSIIAKCLEQDPDLRYATASALAEDLWRFQQGAPLQSSNRRPLTRFLLTGLKQSKPWLLILAGCGLTAALWTARQAQVWSADRRQMELAQHLVLRAEEQAGEFRQELMLPIHDLQPSYARIRGRIELDRRLIQSLAPKWQAQGHFALGITSYLVRDFATAKLELEQALAGGFRDPEVAELLAWVTLAVSRAAAEAAQFDPELPAAAPSGMDEISLRQTLEGAPGSNPGSLLAFLGKDYAQAAALSHATFMASPWRWEAAALESASLRTLGRKEQDAGNLAMARTRYQEGMGAARAALAVGQSDPALYHACCCSARELVALDLESGRPPGTALPELQVTSEQALRLNPADPELQDDWLAMRMLKVWSLRLAGQDPEPELAAARAFIETRTREPFTTRLRADRMLVYWQTAEREFHRGGDPGPALTEALKTSGHTPFLFRDFLWEVLNFKARVDAARGMDPRPTLDTALNHLQPLQQGVPWSLKETFASTWLIRAEWEAGHGLDPALSLRNARILAESARTQNPDSASCYALEGLALVQEMKAFPRVRAQLRPMAQARLEQALARSTLGPNQVQLKRELARLPR